MIDVRIAIDDLRVAAGGNAYSFTDPVLTPNTTPIKVEHVNEMRSALH